MVSSRLFTGFIALASFHAVNAGACRPRSSTAIVSGTDITLTTAETSFQTSIETETSSVTAQETTTLETTFSFTSVETSVETSFVTEDDLTTTLESTQDLDFTTDITSFITLPAETTTSELPATTSGFVPADLFPCESAESCSAVEFCDQTRCGCVDGFCKLIDIDIGVPIRRRRLH
uniref:Extracellular membrane protein CFEM domain-containing protein n=1 Tax=Gibberella zeae TaxID=5518 RepID=A0A4E9EL92_GIBZA